MLPYAGRAPRIKSILRFAGRAPRTESMLPYAGQYTDYTLWGSITWSFVLVQEEFINANVIVMYMLAHTVFRL